MRIPQIIHQIGPKADSPKTRLYRSLAEIWKRDYPDWQYIYWDDEMIEDFVAQEFPGLLDDFHRFPYNVQRWDAVRYLILYKMGGMYVDCDYESIEPMDQLLADCECAFALEPESHVRSHRHHHEQVFNNALMLAVPGHPFFKTIIDNVFSEESLSHDAMVKDVCVFETTGPWHLVDLYDCLPEEEKKQVFLIPAKYVTPFDIPQAVRFRMGERSQELEDCLAEAYAVHYFFGAWRPGTK